MKLRFLGGAMRRMRRLVLTRSGPLARRALYPVPGQTPVHRPVIHVARDAGIGDVVMCTPALRELKRRNPSGQVIFYTNFGELVRGLPYIDEVRPYADAPKNRIFIEYTDIMPSPVHIARLMGDRLGVDVTDTRPDCMIDAGLVAGYRAAWADLPRPHVVILRRASRFTPNKDWPDRSWCALFDGLVRAGSVIEIGTEEPDLAAWSHENYRDLRGRTSVAELAAIVAAADLYVGPVSGPMQIAAAARTPAVTIIGGYEHEVNAHYDGNIAFYTPVPCAPCWLRSPCPHGLACLHAITSDQVLRAVGSLWASHQRRGTPSLVRPELSAPSIAEAVR